MEQKDFFLYMHTGSGNHGCEAIARTMPLLLQKKVVLFSKRLDEDYNYDLHHEIQIIESGNMPSKMSMDGFLMRLKMKFLNQKFAFVIPSYKKLINHSDNHTIAISIGGDNYCYDGMPEVLSILNLQLNNAGAKTVLYGCSIEPDLLKNKSIVEDLNRYSLIVPRETITYEALLNAGLKEKTLLASDPAFTLNKIVCNDADELIGADTVGINISPLVLEGGHEILFEAYCKLIEWIIHDTNMKIALIPHVVWDENDDRIPLHRLYDLYRNTGRVVMIQDHNAMELKGYISKCRFFVGARTHATIAAYSSLVPTLVVGYSVKSKGIAKDIFGSIDQYVIDSQLIKSNNELLHQFQWIYDHEQDIITHLKEVMPNYINNAYHAVGEILAL